MKTRRNFLKASALGLAAPVVSSYSATANVLDYNATTELNLGVAGYTFAQLSLDQALTIMQKVNVRNLSIKDFHLPLDSSQEKIDEVMGKCKAAGVNVYAVGVIYMKTQAEVDRAFDYAKKVGVNLIVGVPNYDLLPYTEEKVKSTGIRIAIHNHGPDNPLYSLPNEVYDRVKNMDPRMGLCIDIGHTLRGGQDPAKAIASYKGRLFDLHIKDVSKAAKEGHGMEMGRGILDIPSVIKALKKANFTGMCSIEYEKDMKDPLAGIAESFGYFRGVMKVV